MFPIRDHNPSNQTPYVTYALMAINIAVFMSYWSILDSPRALSQFYTDWAMIPERIVGGNQMYTMITSTFLHGGFMHLAGNMLFLWIFGDNMEEEFGHIGYLIFYLAAGWLSNFAHLLSAPLSPIPIVGASGAIAGVMGGYLLLFPKAKIDILIIFIVFFRVFPVPAWISLGLWFAIQVVSGTSLTAADSGVAHWAHAGGFIVGLVFTLPLWLKRGGRSFWETHSYHPPHPAAEYELTRSRIPIIKKRP